MFLYNSWKHPLILEQKDKESYEINDYIISAKNKCSTVYCTLNNRNDTVTFLINTQVFWNENGLWFCMLKWNTVHHIEYYSLPSAPIFFLQTIIWKK